MFLEQVYLKNSQAQSESGRSASSMLTHGRLNMYTSASSSLGATDGTYTYIDEEYLQCLQKHMNWDRENGIIHLIPIAVVYQEDMC